MISFESDYNTGAHPEILKRLSEKNFEPLSGYGDDKYTKSAKNKIAKLCNVKSTQVELLVGGTQTNSTVISTLLKDDEGVIAVDTGHISVHEAGAIEFTGHKVLTIKGTDGKLSAKDLKEYLKDFYNDSTYLHMVIPGMVYISYPTEFGTIYTKNELKEIYKVCKKYKMPLFIDGARLGYGLMSKKSNLSIRDIARFSDVFYIGGTKVGAFCGEAIVFTKNNKPKNYITSIKKRGALLAKGRLLGIQFDTLFTKNLYFDISKYAITMAEKLKNVFKENGFRFYIDSPTNQQFIVVDNKTLGKLKRKVAFSTWCKLNEKETVIRFVTTWSTKDSDIEYISKVLKNIKGGFHLKNLIKLGKSSKK